jgi:hypothetical protein
MCMEHIRLNGMMCYMVMNWKKVVVSQGKGLPRYCLEGIRNLKEYILSYFRSSIRESNLVPREHKAAVLTT